MKKVILMMFNIIVCMSLSHISFAGPAVLIEDEPDDISSSSKMMNISPLSQRTTYRQTHAGQTFGSSYELRSLRRVGIGAEFAGASGLMGAVIELNFVPEDSFITGFGGGSGYNSFQMGWHHSFGGEKLSPYVGLGYVRWYNSSNKSVEETNPKFLGTKFLSDKEKTTGQYSVNFLTPNLGLQYHVLAGDYVGASVFAEVRFFMSIAHLSPEALGSLGTIYYF
jgi:hypothetical protein